jgi:hypothetical protein
MEQQLDLPDDVPVRLYHHDRASLVDNSISVTKIV